ncbi:MAG: sulfur carrier protein ThiS [Acidobacteriaceae bacterium]|nr:sulfur carrier protein ThiS [Acidobacteriaceae bacterium]
MQSSTEQSTAGQFRPIEVSINGESRQVPPGQTIEQLLHWLNLNSERVAVELNKQIVRKRSWAEAHVQDGARIEIVEFVGGG